MTARQDGQETQLHVRECANARTGVTRGRQVDNRPQTCLARQARTAHCTTTVRYWDGRGEKNEALLNGPRRKT